MARRIADAIMPSADRVAAAVAVGCSEGLGEDIGPVLEVRPLREGFHREDLTAAFVAGLRRHGAEVRVLELPGAGHNEAAFHPLRLGQSALRRPYPSKSRLICKSFRHAVGDHDLAPRHAAVGCRDGDDDEPRRLTREAEAPAKKCAASPICDGSVTWVDRRVA
jgi:hypothetical protein